MTSLCRLLELLLCLQLLLNRASGEEPEPTFRARGSVIEMGYCFGVDYIVVYRSAPGAEQLLGNSSADSSAATPPANLLGRVRLSQHHQLLGLQIRNLTHTDSGIYRRECWQDQKLVSQLTQQLSVCDEEVESEEIIVKEGAAGVELRCNTSSTGLDGASVRWYHEVYPSYRLSLFLDSSVSPHPLLEDMKGVVEVRDRGAILVIDKSVLKTSQHFHCLVMKGKKCLSFQNIYLPDHTESRDIFVSHGDRVVLKCPSDGGNQQWDTPLGKLNRSSARDGPMYVSAGDRSQDFSLVIPDVADEHGGEYSCISTSLELQYSLSLCPKKPTQEKTALEGRSCSMECQVSHEENQRVLWYRTEASGEHKVILDLSDAATPSPEDLRGRVALSGNGSSLMISRLQGSDAGVYWCVVLGGPEFLEQDGDYTYDYDGEDTEDDEYGDEQLWHGAHRCIFKQETVLTLIKPVTSNPTSRILEADPAAAADPPPPPASNITAYAAGAGAAVLLLVGAIAAAIVIRKKRANSRSGIKTNKDIKMNEDPGCTKSLTGDECGA